MCFQVGTNEIFFCATLSKVFLFNHLTIKRRNSQSIRTWNVFQRKEKYFIHIFIIKKLALKSGLNMVCVRCSEKILNFTNPKKLPEHLLFLIEPILLKADKKKLKRLFHFTSFFLFC
uniref:Uncharacterized protein n=1 Tax=Cacopsylla melanoneura TaxID=428564 RepID=A0A8D8ZGD9_9HEMI